MTLNPALTGNFNGDYRIGLNYRNQWQSVTRPYRTLSGYFDMGLLKGSKDGFVGVGLVMLNDVAGDGNLSTQKYFGSAAYHLYVDQDDKLMISVGLGIGFVQKKLDYNKLIFDDQWTGTGFNPAIQTAEPTTEQPISYLDMQLGATASYQVNDDNVIYGGLNIIHLMQPKESFSDKDNNLGTRPLFHAGGIFRLSAQVHAEPALLYMRQKKAQEFMIGANIGYQPNLTQDTKVFAGGWYRGTGDVIVAAGVEYRRVRMIISYDINLSQLQPASNSRGGFELSMYYIWNRKPSRLSEIIVPCIRY